MNERTAGGADISLKTLQVANWGLLAVMSAAGWLLYSAFIGGSIVVGGVIANIGFGWLKRDITRLLSGPLQAAKARFFIKYYARLAILVAILFFLIKYRAVHHLGLLAGLSTVVLGIGVTVAGGIKKIYFNNVKEAS